MLAIRKTAVPSPEARRKLGEEATMLRLTLRYARYALTALSTVGFGNWSN